MNKVFILNMVTMLLSVVLFVLAEHSYIFQAVAALIFVLVMLTIWLTIREFEE